VSGPPVNPFAAPAVRADRSVQLTKRPGFLWRPYCWIVVPVWLYALMFAGIPRTWDVYGHSLLFAVSIAGMLGYVYRRRLLRPRFWAVWLPVQALADLVGLTIYLTDGWSTFRTDAILTCAIGYACLFPVYLALYRYAHQSHDLWHPPVVSSAPVAP
jgi:hypothetical protein